MEILLYGNRKQNNVAWDISNLEKRKIGFFELYKYLRDPWRLWDNDSRYTDLRNRAEAGDAEPFLNKVNGEEYVSFECIDIIDT